MHSLLSSAAVFGEAAAKGQPNPLIVLLPQIVLIVAILYFVMIRPQQKKAKEFKALLASVKKGDRVVTQGGLHGIVAQVKDDIIVLRVDDNVKCEFDKTAIVRVEQKKEKELETSNA